MKHYILFLLLFLSACSSEKVESTTHLTEKRRISTEDTTTIQNSRDQVPLYHHNFSFISRIDSVSVFNKIALDKKCYLINTTTLSTIAAVTVAHQPLILEASGLHKIITRVATASSSSYDLAYFGHQADISAVPTDSVTDLSLIDSLHRKIDLLHSSEHHFTKYGNSISNFDSLLSPHSAIIQFDYLGETCFLVQYYWQFHQDYQQQGIAVLVTPMGIYPLTGPCSSSINLFTLNERLYLKTNANCCDCGSIVDLLYEYDSIELMTVLEDGSWST